MCVFVRYMLLAGLLHLLMAALNMGVVIRFISDSVLSGFTCASAILISFSQAPRS